MPHTLSGVTGVSQTRSELKDAVDRAVSQARTDSDRPTVRRVADSGWLDLLLASLA